MPPDDPTPRENPQSVPILDYRAVATPSTGREKLAAVMEVLGVLAAMFAAFAVLLTIEMMFLILVDLWTRRTLMQGELGYTAIAAVSAAALIGVSFYATRLSAKMSH
jgi:hypothetical protein